MQFLRTYVAIGFFYSVSVGLMSRSDLCRRTYENRTCVRGPIKIYIAHIFFQIKFEIRSYRIGPFCNGKIIFYMPINNLMVRLCFLIFLNPF